MFEKYLEILSKVSLFKGINELHIIPMLNCLDPRVYTYAKNDLIKTAGEKFESIGVVLEGTASVSKENAAGNRVIMTLLQPSELFGEIVAFSKHSQWPATVQAQTECTVLFLPREKIIGQCKNMCPWHKIMIENMLKILSEKALLLNKKVEYLTIKSIQGKLSAFLLDQYAKTGKNSFMLTMNRNELADFLSISRPSMSREMCKLRDNGIIDFHLNAIKILNLNALKELCCS